MIEISRHRDQHLRTQTIFDIITCLQDRSNIVDLCSIFFPSKREPHSLTNLGPSFAVTYFSIVISIDSLRTRCTYDNLKAGFIDYLFFVDSCFILFYILLLLYIYIYIYSFYFIYYFLSYFVQI